MRIPRGSRPAPSAPAATRSRLQSVCPGEHQLSAAPSYRAPASCSICGPSAARYTGAPGTRSRSASIVSRMSWIGLSRTEPAPTPSTNVRSVSRVLRAPVTIRSSDQRSSRGSTEMPVRRPLAACQRAHRPNGSGPFGVQRLVYPSRAASAATAACSASESTKRPSIPRPISIGGTVPSPCGERRARGLPSGGP